MLVSSDVVAYGLETCQEQQGFPLIALSKCTADTARLKVVSILHATFSSQQYFLPLKGLWITATMASCVLITFYVLHNVLQMYDAFNPNAYFKRRSPGEPDFSVTMAADPFPDLLEIKALEQMMPSAPIVHAIVDNGDVMFFTLTQHQSLPL